MFCTYVMMVMDANVQAIWIPLVIIMVMYGYGYLRTWLRSVPKYGKQHVDGQDHSKGIYAFQDKKTPFYTT